MIEQNYLMESKSETYRLDIKTDANIVKEQALWGGIKPGMRVADLGFGSGKTSYALNQLVQPGGQVVAVDYVQNRIEFAESKYPHKSIQYITRDIRYPLEDLGTFDFIWIRFVLEYHKSKAFNILQNVSKLLKPGGILQLIDLDHNCLCHFGLSGKLEKTLFDLMNLIQNRADFDPYVGRKLYSFLYDLGYEKIDVNMMPHHLFFGEIGDADTFNWMQKAEVAVKQLNFNFEGYPGGFDEFYEEFMAFFKNPRRLTYTPLFLCKGIKPL